MCGIFGYIAKHGRGPDLARLRRIALETKTRGRHAFGLAWLDRAGHLHTYKRPGAASAALEDLERVRDAMVVVGHCRLATHGAPAINHNNHPHSAGSGWLVHNGVVRNYRQLARRYELTTQTECDSEVLGLMLARMVGPLDLRAARTAANSDVTRRHPWVMNAVVGRSVRKRTTICCYWSRRGRHHITDNQSDRPI